MTGNLRRRQPHKIPCISRAAIHHVEEKETARSIYKRFPCKALHKDQFWMQSPAEKMGRGKGDEAVPKEDPIINWWCWTRPTLWLLKGRRQVPLQGKHGVCYRDLNSPFVSPSTMLNPTGPFFCQGGDTPDSDNSCLLGLWEVSCWPPTCPFSLLLVKRGTF